MTNITPDVRAIGWGADRILLAPVTEDGRVRRDLDRVAPVPTGDTVLRCLLDAVQPTIKGVRAIGWYELATDPIAIVDEHGEPTGDAYVVGYDRREMDDLVFPTERRPVPGDTPMLLLQVFLNDLGGVMGCGPARDEEGGRIARAWWRYDDDVTPTAELLAIGRTRLLLKEGAATP